MTFAASTSAETDFTLEPFEISTPDFAGPMDLMVFLVRRRELDVAYISVSAIAQDFLDWLDRHDLPDLDTAGDFILLAATLLQFKLANLLPGDEPELSDAELMSYRRQRSEEELEALRETAYKLAELEERQINLFGRGNITLSGVEEELTSDMTSNVSALDLALTFRDLIYRLPEEPTHIVEDIPYTLEGQMAFVASFFGDAKKMAFQKLADALQSRLAVIMTFLAILELMRTGRLKVVQPGPYESIILILRDKREIDKNRLN